MALLCGMMPMTAQVSVDYYRGDGTRYVCSQQEVMYDDYFHAARFAVSAIADAGGLVTFALEVTYDEGMLDWLDSQENYQVYQDTEDDLWYVAEVPANWTQAAEHAEDYSDVTIPLAAMADT